MRLKKEELKEFLDEKVDLYNRPEFIDHDPISIPHLFTKKEDIEISGFLTATIAWGNRTAIINNAGRMMEYLDNSPYEFIMESSGRDLERIKGVIHRTFDSSDFVYFIKALRHIYNTHNGLEGIFMKYRTDDSLQPAIHMLKRHFFELPHDARTEKHISDPCRGSAAKKINMFLRWMVRKDNRGVDFGLWKSIPPSILSCPLDVHSGNVARKLGLLKRKQNDAKAVSELDSALRSMDKEDPVKYDFALFGLEASGEFENLKI
ncbi:MAG TPA: TIGR02757 family protein [Bacteroidales bacterium]|nr:TIGR02757 family protein [Bacteroidales bacterium]HQG36096.1 TIGR02757 family protein [Bacteroidales bacterium]HRC88403.1 TIGR02757 family protein [Bacteroidales bacterium]